MNPKTTALFIGRFQPFHLGHLDAIEQIYNTGKTETLLVGIGSAEDNFLPENPFAAGERFQMIQNSLQEAGFSPAHYHILPLRNIHNYALWAQHVVQMIPPFARIYSGSPLVRHLFATTLSGTSAPEVCTLQENKKISATHVRQAIKEKKDFAHMLPPACCCVLKKIYASERLQILDQTGFRKTDKTT